MRRLTGDDRGVTTVLIAVLMPVLLAAAALGIDSGRLLLAKQQAQAGADALALAAAMNCSAGKLPNTAPLPVVVGTPIFESACGATQAGTTLVKVSTGNIGYSFIPGQDSKTVSARASWSFVGAAKINPPLAVHTTALPSYPFSPGSTKVLTPSKQTFGFGDAGFTWTKSSGSCEDTPNTGKSFTPTNNDTVASNLYGFACLKANEAMVLNQNFAIPTYTFGFNFFDWDCLFRYCVTGFATVKISAYSSGFVDTPGPDKRVPPPMPSYTAGWVTNTDVNTKTQYPTRPPDGCGTVPQPHKNFFGQLDDWDVSNSDTPCIKMEFVSPAALPFWQWVANLVGFYKPGQVNYGTSGPVKLTA